jgi:hypothetical protein
MARESSKEAVRQQVEEHQREAERRELEEAQEEARESFEALQENLSGTPGRDLGYPEFRWEGGVPRVTGVEPRIGLVPGKALTIIGERLDLVQAVRIGGCDAEAMAVVGHERLHVVVPPDARDGWVELVTDEPERERFDARWPDDEHDREQKED